MEDGTTLGDRFILYDLGTPLGAENEGYRRAALLDAAGIDHASHCGKIIGKQVIATLDEKWNPEDYTSTLIRT